MNKILRAHVNVREVSRLSEINASIDQSRMGFSLIPFRQVEGRYYTSAPIIQPIQQGCGRHRADNLCVCRRYFIPDQQGEAEFYLCRGFLNWQRYIQQWTFSGEKFKAQYELWEHADQLVNRSSSLQDLHAAVIQLNRAVDFRDKLLDSSYHFKSIPGAPGTNKHAVMTELGLMRPYMKNMLDKIRNILEHQDEGKEISIQTCQQLSDFVWYYLRSTDPLACRCPSAIIFSTNEASIDRDIFLECEFQFAPWQFRLGGTSPAKSVSIAPKDNYLTVRGQWSTLANGLCEIQGILVAPPEEQFLVAKLCLTTL